MKSVGTANIDRRKFLALGLGAVTMGLTACSSGNSKESYEEGYSAGYSSGYTAGIEAGKAESTGANTNTSTSTSADTSESSKAETSNVPESGIEYTINGVSLGTVKYSSHGTGVALVLDLTAKNVSNEAKSAIFIGSVVNAYQDGKALDEAFLVEGYETSYGTEIKPGATLNGWVAYELLDETTPVELEAGTINASSGKTPYYGLTNPQTVDTATL